MNFFTYQIVKDNDYLHVYLLERAIFGVFWHTVFIGTLERCKIRRTKLEIGKPRYTVIER